MTPDVHQWQRGGQFFDHRGHQIFWREEGSGRPLLLLHGFPTSSWDWVKVWPELVRRYHVVAPDLLGFGWSEKPRHYDYLLTGQADLVEDLLDELGVDEIDVLAHDYGDSVAQELLARHEESRPSRITVRSIAFLNGGLFPETHRPLFVQRLLLGPLGPLVGRWISESSARARLQSTLGPGARLSDEEWRGMWSLLEHGEQRRVLHRLIRYMPERAVHRDRWVAAMRGTEVPLKLIDGPEDPISGRHLVGRYRELVPEPDTVLLDGVGHYPQLEDPAAVVGAYLAFRSERVG